jgi:hypothetical protein
VVSIDVGGREGARPVVRERDGMVDISVVGTSDGCAREQVVVFGCGIE